MAIRKEHSGPLKTMICGVLFVLGGCWFWYHLVGNPLDELALIRRGQTVPGSIIEAWEDAEDGSAGGTKWYHRAVYEYRMPGGLEYKQHTKDLPGRLGGDLGELKQPYPIEVEYLPDNPALSRIKGNGCQSVGEWLWRKAGLGIFLLALFLSPGIAMFLRGARDLRKVFQGNDEATVRKQ